jgi:hypothetical protein
VAKHGEPFDEEWLAGAAEAQEAAEAACLAAGFQPWKVQRPSEEGLEEMKAKRGRGRPPVAAAAKAAVADPSQQNLKKFVVPMKTLYEESAKAPETLPTDTCKIWKEEIDGDTIWVAENGMVFACCESTGEPAELLGRRVNGDFLPA